MDDLIKRLNDGIDVIEQTSGGWAINLSGTQNLIAEAATALTEAQAEIARLREGLIGVKHSGSLAYAKMTAKEALSPREGEG